MSCRHGFASRIILRPDKNEMETPAIFIKLRSGSRVETMPAVPNGQVG